MKMSVWLFTRGCWHFWRRQPVVLFYFLTQTRGRCLLSSSIKLQLEKKILQQGWGAEVLVAPFLNPEVEDAGASWDEDDHVYHEDNGGHNRAWSDDKAVDAKRRGDVHGGLTKGTIIVGTAHKYLNGKTKYFRLWQWKICGPQIKAHISI